MPFGFIPPLVRHIQSVNATFSSPNMAFRWAKCGIYVFKGPYTDVRGLYTV